MYSSKGSQHQALGLAGIREALSDDMTESSNYALFAASSFLITNTFATRLKNDDSPDASAPLCAILDIFALVLGTIAIDMFAAEKLRMARPSDDFLDTTPLGVDDTFLLPSLRIKLQDLRYKIDAAFHDGESAQLKKTLDQGIVCFLNCTETVPGPSLFTTAQQRIMHFWPMTVGDDFKGLIRTCNPPALVIFSYYCVVLQVMEQDSWYLDGWTDALAGSLTALLRDSPWFVEASWPLERCRAGRTKPDITTAGVSKQQAHECEFDTASSTPYSSCRPA